MIRDPVYDGRLYAEVDADLAKDNGGVDAPGAMKRDVHAARVTAALSKRHVLPDLVVIRPRCVRDGRVVATEAVPLCDVPLPSEQVSLLTWLHILKRLVASVRQRMALAANGQRLGELCMVLLESFPFGVAHPVLLAELCEFASVVLGLGLCTIDQMLKLLFLGACQTSSPDDGGSHVGKVGDSAAQSCADAANGAQWPWNSMRGCNECASSDSTVSADGKESGSGEDITSLDFEAWRLRYAWVDCNGDDAGLVHMVRGEDSVHVGKGDEAAQRERVVAHVGQQYPVTMDGSGRNAASFEPLAIQSLVVIQHIMLTYGATPTTVRSVVTTMQPRLGCGGRLDTLVYVRQMLEFILLVNGANWETVYGSVIRVIIGLDRQVDIDAGGQRDGFDIVVDSTAAPLSAEARESALVLDGTMACTLRFVRRLLGGGHHARLRAFVSSLETGLRVGAGGKPLWSVHLERKLHPDVCMRHRLRFFLKMLDEFGALVQQMAGACVVQYIIFFAASFNSMLQSVFCEYCQVCAGGSTSSQYDPDKARQDMQLTAPVFTGRQFLFAGFLGGFLSRCKKVKGRLLGECVTRLLCVVLDAVSVKGPGASSETVSTDGVSTTGKGVVREDGLVSDVWGDDDNASVPPTALEEKTRPVLAFVQALFSIICFRRRQLLPGLIEWALESDNNAVTQEAVEGNSKGSDTLLSNEYLNGSVARSLRSAASNGAPVPDPNPRVSRALHELKASEISQLTMELGLWDIVNCALRPLSACCEEVVEQFVCVAEATGLMRLRHVTGGARGRARDQLLAGSSMVFSSAGGEKRAGASAHARSTPQQNRTGDLADVSTAGDLGSIAVSKVLDTFFPFRQYEDLSSSRRLVLPLMVRFMAIDKVLDTPIDDTASLAVSPGFHAGSVGGHRGATLGARLMERLSSPEGRVGRLSATERNAVHMLMSPPGMASEDGSASTPVMRATGMSPRMRDQITSPSMGSHLHTARTAVLAARRENEADAEGPASHDVMGDHWSTSLWDKSPGKVADINSLLSQPLYENGALEEAGRVDEAIVGIVSAGPGGDQTAPKASTPQSRRQGGGRRFVDDRSSQSHGGRASANDTNGSPLGREVAAVGSTPGGLSGGRSRNGRDGPTLRKGKSPSFRALAHDKVKSGMERLFS